MTPHERIEELEAEVAYLRSELGLALDTDRLARLRASYGFTRSEGILLLTLATTNRVMSKAHLMDALDHSKGGTDNKMIDVYVHRIRSTLPGSIITHYGLGYGIAPKGMEAVQAA